jgi:nitrite reductase/ring-hydroxylating ferredoxin subunit
MTRHFIGSTSDLPFGRLKRIEVAGKSICLVHTADGFHAIANDCSHEGAPLSEGDLYEMSVECPRHGSRFDVRTGAVTSLPAQEPVESYVVSVEGDRVFLTLKG